MQDFNTQIYNRLQTIKLKNGERRVKSQKHLRIALLTIRSSHSLCFFIFWDLAFKLTSFEYDQTLLLIWKMYSTKVKCYGLK